MSNRPTEILVGNRYTAERAYWRRQEKPDYTGAVKTLQRVQDDLKWLAHDQSDPANPAYAAAMLNIGRLDAVIESLGGQPSGERW